MFSTDRSGKKRETWSLADVDAVLAKARDEDPPIYKEVKRDLEQQAAE